MRTLVAFLGGNGHCAARLASAREAARRAAAGAAPALDLRDVAYPGFEGRPRAPSLEAFLDAVGPQLDDARLVYATGIGGLLALGLRARGEVPGAPLLLQAPVLWGLERRLMPRLVRLAPVRRLLPVVFALPAYQRRFFHRCFTRSHDGATRAAFFAGYAQCAALGDLFAWLTPAWLRRLEAAFAERPAALGDVTVWWGGRDQVVTVEELRFTEAALGVRWPLRVFEEWGHYPMIDDPEGWVDALGDAP